MFHIALLFAAPVDAGTTTLIPFGRIMFGSSCQKFLTYYPYNNNTYFVGPSPVNQHWYLASDSSKPNVYAIVSHPVPNKALNISCNTDGCLVNVVPIPQLYPGWTFPSLKLVGASFFFYKIYKKDDEVAFLSYKNPSFALTVSSNDKAIVSKYNRKRYDQCFCRPQVSGW